MLQTSLQDTGDRTPEVSSRPRISSRSGSRVQPVAMACSSVAMGAVHPHRSKGGTIWALMDLARGNIRYDHTGHGL